jgi:hypothetical protein
MVKEKTTDPKVPGAVKNEPAPVTSSRIEDINMALDIDYT